MKCKILKACCGLRSHTDIDWQGQASSSAVNYVKVDRRLVGIVGEAFHDGHLCNKLSVHHTRSSSMSVMPKLWSGPSSNATKNHKHAEPAFPNWQRKRKPNPHAAPKPPTSEQTFPGPAGWPVLCNTQQRVNPLEATFPTATGCSARRHTAARAAGFLACVTLTLALQPAASARTGVGRRTAASHKGIQAMRPMKPRHPTIHLPSPQHLSD